MKFTLEEKLYIFDLCKYRRALILRRHNEIETKKSKALLKIMQKLFKLKLPSGLSKEALKYHNMFPDTIFVVNKKSATRGR